MTFEYFLGGFSTNTRTVTITNATIITRDEHNISRANISPNALKVLYRLNSEGFQAYLVGGGVRDLLLGREPKDFDVATNATPEEVKTVFRNCRLIGRRFRLAHVFFGRETIEVATFRSKNDAAAQEEQQSDKGMILRDNVYGTIEEDALRRDFSVNALYYGVEDFSIIDYAGGMQDLEEGRLRLLGDPEERYREDPVRMLRAVRFASKLGFTIDHDCESCLAELSHLLEEVPAARLFEEVLKLFMGGTALIAFEKLRHYDLFSALFPETDEVLSFEEHNFPITFVNRGVENTDRRIADGKPVTPAFLFAVLLWEPVRLLAKELEDEDGLSTIDAMQEAGYEVLKEQLQSISLPKRFSIPMREIWSLQGRFERRSGKQPQRLASHPRFRAAYDFLVLRAEAGETDMALADWWTQYQGVDDEERNQMISALRGSERG
ncbi:MAG: polynucleotide adenylyltransferase PcnB, partial [Candidatus Polarisedimenticolaceae bacterium]|nr:polynucleotide adenylyltransferase PcnB [Candidatus Polarisedimenticolaceae bacterium]